MSVQPGAPAETRQAQAALATAAAYQAEQEAETDRLVTTVLALWASLEAKKAWDSWTIGGIGQRIYVLLSSLMELVAADAGGYVRQVLADQDVRYNGPAINPVNFAGIASDGRDLESLLRGAVVKLRQSQRGGLSDAKSKEHGRNFLELVVRTQVSDAARAAESVGVTVAEGQTPTGRPVMVGWIRMLTPPSCGRCAVLAGKFYKWNSGFKRHPNCFPAGTVVSGPRLDAATRRWFEGELVTIRTASGQELSVTGNHPVLTDSGWAPARLLQEGDNVIRSLGAKTAFGQIPDDHQVPALVEDIFRALSMAVLATKVPSTAEDFHGDGASGEVDVVTTDGHLRLEEVAGVVQVAPESLLGSRFESPLLHSGASGLMESEFAGTGASNGFVSGGGLGTSLLDGHLARAEQARLGLIADLNILLKQASPDGSAAEVVLLAERILALASRVLRRESGQAGVQDDPARWDAPAGAFSMETRAGYASRGLDLIERLSGQVTADRIVEKVSRQWSGHVYNLTSSQGWLIADGIVTSNCDCRHLPCTVAGSSEMLTNPKVYFESLTEEEQNYYFGKADAQAIRDGGDIYQIVNAGRTAMYTSDDGRRYKPDPKQRGDLDGTRMSGRLVLRPTVWQIYRDAGGNQEVAKAMLKRYGYTHP
jgi:hypothetical protein